MFAKNNRISGRQAMRLITFDLLGVSALFIPAALASLAERDGIFSIGIGFLLGGIYLWILKKVTLKMQGSYGEYLLNVFGAFWGKIIKFGYWIYFLLFAGRVASLFAELVGKELIEEQFRLILLIIMGMVLYGSAGGIEGRARVYEILFWILLLPLGILILFALPTVDSDYWAPVFHMPVRQIAKGGYQVFLDWAALCLLPFFAEYVKDKEQLYRGGRQALVLTGLVVGVLYIVLLGMFGGQALATMDYPVVTMMSRIQITGGFLKRTDAFMFGIWFFMLYALLNSLVFFGSRLGIDFFQKVATMLPALSKHITEQKLARCSIVAETVFVFVIADRFFYSETFQMLFNAFFWYIGTPFVVAIPVILLLKDRKIGCKHMVGTLGMLLCLFLNGCTATELEKREFPVMLTVREGENFSKGWLEGKVSGIKKVDYNHLKVILIEREFLEDEMAMRELLTVLKQDKNVPWNAYVVTADDIEAVNMTEDYLKMPLGNYLEALLEHADKVKKEAYPTIGMLYQESKNQIETLYIPYISVEQEKPQISAYQIWKRGAMAGHAEVDAAMLAFFVSNQLKEYELELTEENFVQLSHSKNQISFRETRASSGLLQKQVIVKVSCEGKVIYQTIAEENNEAYVELGNLAAAYMQQTADGLLEQGIDITNSKKKLGEMHSWYRQYEGEAKPYEEDIEIVFELKIKWIDS